MTGPLLAMGLSNRIMARPPAPEGEFRLTQGQIERTIDPVRQFANS